MVLATVRLTLQLGFFPCDFEHRQPGWLTRGISAKQQCADGQSQSCPLSPLLAGSCSSGRYPGSLCLRLLQQVKQQEIIQGFMQQTRLGSSSVTSAVVTACSLVVLQTSCPPGTSFPTCFLWLLPSEFGSKLRIGRSSPFQHQTIDRLDCVSMQMLISSLQSRALPMQVTQKGGSGIQSDPPKLFTQMCTCYLPPQSCSQVLCRTTLSKSFCGFSSLLPLLPSSGTKSLSGLVVHILATFWACASAEGLSLFYFLCYGNCQVLRWVWDRNTKQEVCSLLQSLMLSFLAGQV